VNKWDCRPLSRRIVNPDKIRNFHKQLSTIEQNKIMTLNDVICVTASSKEKKRARGKITTYQVWIFMFYAAFG